MRKLTTFQTRQRRLRWLLGALFVGLALPAALLIRQGFAQIETTEFRRQQLLAEDLVNAIDDRLATAIAIENARPVTDFDYALPSPGGAPNVVQLSPLSSLAAASAFPGNIGYFQVDASGQLSTPLLPDAGREALPGAERLSKMAIEEQLAEVLEANRLVDSRPASAPAPAPALRGLNAGGTRQLVPVADRRGQAAFDELETNADADADAASAAVVVTGTRIRRSERPDVPISAFAGDIEPLRSSLLETGHLVLYRNAWRDGERFVQGMLIDRDVFIEEAFGRALAGARLTGGTQLGIAVSGERLRSLTVPVIQRGASVDGSSLYRARLSPPLAGIELAFTAGALGRGPGFSLLAWTALALFAVLIGGFAAMYRFGMQQLQLARQQQNFVSAVSHELKTPLTSIRMYGEMLKSGWADEQKKQQYYDYIFDEGERLSRLIDNVLQLARLNRSGPALAMKPVPLSELFDVLRSKLSTQAERAGFTLSFELDPEQGATRISIDTDALSQVFINLVDNAIKFAANADRREIVIRARLRDRHHVDLTVRDFGPGVPDPAMKRLFELFYRPDNEMTRTTAGTGIGLALVRQLVTAMSGRVDVRNRDPGAEFRIELPDVR